MRSIFTFVFLREFFQAAFWSFWAASLLEEGRSLNEAAMALGIFFLTNAILEVPTGIFADRYGRKLSTLLGFGLVSIGYGLNGFHGNSPVKLTAFALTGFGFTLMSGASTAWLLGLAKSKTAQSTFNQDKFFLEAEIIGRIATIAAAFGAVRLLSIAPQILWWGMAAIGILALGFGMTLEEARELNADSRRRLVLSSTLATLRIPIVTAILVSSLFFGLESAIRNVIYQPFVMDLKRGQLAYLAYFQTTLALARFAGGLFYKYRLIHLKRGIELSVLSLLVFAGAQFFVARVDSYLSFVMIYGPAIFTLGWYFPVRDSYLNMNIPDSIRATALSVDSMVNKFASAAGCLILGLMMERTSISGLWNYGAVFLVFAAVALGVARVVRKLELRN